MIHCSDCNHQNKIITDLNQGSVSKTMFLFAIPLLLSSVLQMLYTTTDMIVVGHFVNKNGLSAVTIGGELLHFLTFVAMGFSNAGQVIISQYIGAGLRDKASKTVGTLFTFIFFAAIIIGSICLSLKENIIYWINTPGDAVEYTNSYVTVSLYGLFFIYGYNVISAILRGMGDSRHPFVFVAIATSLNVILDLVFVIIFKLAIFGVALATVLSQGVSFICAIIFLFCHREYFGFDFKLSSFKIDREILTPLLKLGIPMLFQSALISFSMLFVNAFINTYGVVAVAVTGIGHKISMLVNIISFSLSSAASPMIGQAIGGEKYARVPKIIGVAVFFNFIISSLMALISIITPYKLFGLFTNDKEVLYLAISYIPVCIVLYAGSALRSPFNALINGSGNFKLNLIVGLMDGFVMRVVLSYSLGIVCSFGIFGFWYGHAIAGFTPFIVGGIYFLTGRWRTRKYIIGNKQKRKII